MQKLNTTAVYLLSIFGILCCCFWGLGFVLSIIGLIIANKELKKYAENPEAYTNGPAMKTARTLAIIAVVISGLVAAWTAYEYITYDEYERAERSLEWMRQIGFPEEVLEEAERQAEEQRDLAD